MKKENYECEIIGVKDTKGYTLYTTMYVKDFFGFVERSPKKIGRIRFTSETEKYLFKPALMCSFSMPLLNAIAKFMEENNLK